VLTLFLSSLMARAAPADQLPVPSPERCVGFVPMLSDDGDAAAPEGLDYDQVSAALGAVIQTALRCPRPPERSALNLTFELTVGCNGLVSEIVVTEGDGAPEGYLDCVSAVILRADFPAHDMEGGMPVTYPVNVAW